MTNYIAYSVFGNDEIYLVGALRNAEMQKIYYPGWQNVFYVDKALGHSDFLVKLVDTGSKVVVSDHSISRNKRSWRFAAALLHDAEYVIFRDSDSRLGLREASAVMEWLNSGKPLHIMRDHPFHCDWILAGMWGAHAPTLSEAITRVLNDGQTSDWGEDQLLLAQHVYADFATRAFIHDSFFRREKDTRPFLVSREAGSFVGERISSLELPEIKTRQILAKYELSDFLQKKLRARDWIRRASFAMRTRNGTYLRSARKRE